MTLAPGTDQLESERLVLRRITAADLEFFTRLQADPEVARFIGPGRPRSAEESLGWFEGYATEAARCVFEYACSVLRLPRVISIINPSNSRSLRVAGRFAMDLTDSVELLGKRLDRYVWRLPAGETVASPARPAHGM
jgi:RimJ/RimL family protein N-acetyltransferase